MCDIATKCVSVISTHDPSTLLFTNVNGAVCSFGWEADIALTRTLYELVECEDRGAVQAAVGALKVRSDFRARTAGWGLAVGEPLD